MSAQDGRPSANWRQSKNIRQILDRPRYREPQRRRAYATTDPNTLIEQAIARTGTVEAAAAQLGVPDADVQAVYDAMEEE